MVKTANFMFVCFTTIENILKKKKKAKETNFHNRFMFTYTTT